MKEAIGALGVLISLLVCFCFLIYTGHYYASVIPGLMLCLMKINIGEKKE